MYVCRRCREKIPLNTSFGVYKPADYYGRALNIVVAREAIGQGTPNPEIRMLQMRYVRSIYKRKTEVPEVPKHENEHSREFHGDTKNNG